jgi:membrane associated rhomboid family serine protease
MFGRQREGSVLCPSCGQLVGVNDERCLSCGRVRPGLFGFAALLRNVGDDMGFLGLVLFCCGALYLATLAADPSRISGGGLLGLLSPGTNSLLRFGASGARPVFGDGRWWTVLSASWLHGSLLHILFNMMAVRDLLPLTAHLYGAARTVIIYVLAGAAGFAASVLAFLLPRIPFLGSGGITIGASAALFGLIGALLYYGRRSGNRTIGEAARRWAIGGLLFGFMVPGIDNWAHLGGLGGGYVLARILDPLLPERGDHVLIAVACLVASALAIGASLAMPFTPVPYR